MKLNFNKKQYKRDLINILKAIGFILLAVIVSPILYKLSVKWNILPALQNINTNAYYILVIKLILFVSSLIVGFAFVYSIIKNLNFEKHVDCSVDEKQ